MAGKDFVLAAALPAHSGDVRGLAALPGGSAFVSASRDHSARVWARRGGDGASPFEAVATLAGHTHFLGGACGLGPTPRARWPAGGVATVVSTGGARFLRRR